MKSDSDRFFLQVVLAAEGGGEKTDVLNRKQLLESIDVVEMVVKKSGSASFFYREAARLLLIQNRMLLADDQRRSRMFEILGEYLFTQGSYS